MKETVCIGVDLGGSKIEAIALRWRSPEQYEVLARTRVSTLAEEGYDTVLTQTCLVIAECEQQAQLIARNVPLGLGMPGSIRRQDQRVKNSNALCLNGQDFRGDLQIKLRRPVIFDNDANCFALAEARLGAAAEYGQGAVVFGVIMGTGVGGGWVMHNRVWSGVHLIAGEWGHHCVDTAADSLACYCGHTGCLERYASGPAVEAAYFRATGERRSLSEIAAISQLKASTDHAAVDAMETLYSAFARGLANVVNIVDPSCVVLGGGVSNVDGLYTIALEKARRLIFNDEWCTPILHNKLGDSAGVFGAAMLCVEE